MVNGIGVVGWGVGGIEAEAAMLGQPVSMLIPRVVGFKLTGDLPEGATATDLVLTITEMLRKHGVVGKFVEFYGPGVSALPLANRATIGNMSPEFGSTIAVFPIDEETIKYLELTGRSEEQLALVEAYAKEQGLWHDPRRRAALLREARARPVDRRTVAGRPEAPAGPGLADRRQGVVPRRAGRLRRRRAGDRTATTRRSPSPSRPPTRRPRRTARAAPTTTSPRPRRRRPAEQPGPGHPRGRHEFEVDHGAVAIAAITSCTNTSNPSVMIGAALLAKKAVEKGLTSASRGSRPRWRPGSKVVSDYYERAGLTPYLDKLGFNLVGYGCTTCIGNSGPLIPEVSQAVNDNDLAVVSVLSGNRNFEGRINPDVKMNYLASPPLVVAYALAGSMDVDLFNDPLGQDQRRQRRLHEGHLADRRGGRGGHRDRDHLRDVHRATTPTCSPATSGGRTLPTPDGRHLRLGRGLDLRPQAAVLRRHAGRAGRRSSDIDGARVLLKLGDSVTTDHIRPAGAIKKDSPGRQVPRRARRRAAGLQLLRLAPRQPRGDDPRHVRQHPAAQPAGAGHRGRLHPRLHRATATPVTTIYEASENYLAAGTPLVVLAGKEYGSGSSRDWAAKGTALLGVKAVIAESYERIHRSNLIGMGVLPLQYPEGETAESLGLTGEETFSITGVTALNDGTHPADRQGRRPATSSSTRVVRIDTPGEAELLPQRRDHAVRAAQPPQGLTARPGAPRPRSRGTALGVILGGSGSARVARMPSSTQDLSRGRTAGILAVAWVVIAAAVVAVGWLLTHPFLHSVGDPENNLARWFRDRRTPTLTSLANAFTTPGNTTTALAVALLVVVGLVIWGRKWREALFVLLAVGGVYGIYVLAFTIDHRDRPPVKVLQPGLVPNHSFPSGHVAASTVLYGAIAVLLLAYAPAVARWLVPVLVLVPLLVMVSRLYLGAHHFTDTLTSLLFGAAWLAVLTRVLRPGEHAAS